MLLGFAGFNDNDDDNGGNELDNCGEVDVPLPGNELFHQSAEDQVLNNSYEDEALRLLQQHRLQKNQYVRTNTNLKSDLAIRR